MHHAGGVQKGGSGGQCLRKGADADPEEAHAAAQRGGCRVHPNAAQAGGASGIPAGAIQHNTCEKIDSPVASPLNVKSEDL